jgi:hypothetical protein
MNIRLLVNHSISLARGVSRSLPAASLATRLANAARPSKKSTRPGTVRGKAWVGRSKRRPYRPQHRVHGGLAEEHRQRTRYGCGPCRVLTPVLNLLSRWPVARTKLKSYRKYRGYVSRMPPHQQMAAGPFRAIRNAFQHRVRRGLTEEHREKTRLRCGPSRAHLSGLRDLRAEHAVATAGCENKAEELRKTQELYLANVFPSTNWGGPPPGHPLPTQSSQRSH